MDKLTPILIQALKDAMARPEEQPLYKSGKQPGLFVARTEHHVEAAQQALRDGLLEVVRTDTKGKTETPWVRITPRGVQFVYQHESPKAVLEDLVRVLQLNQQGLPRWVEEMRAQLQGLTNRFQELLERQGRIVEQLLERSEEALRRLNVGPEASTLEAWELDTLTYMDQRKAAAAEECPLPELFNALRRKHPALTVAAFHTGLARLRDRGTLALLPHSGHLSDLAEPEFALLEGAAVYYRVRRA